jgi:c-di-GMP-binding flagellar brake protein YcgR
MQIESLDARARERRRSPRVPFEAPILVRTPGGEAHRGTGENLSELGMLLHTSGEEIARGRQPLWLTFNLPEVPHLLQIQAEVVHHRRDGQMVTIGLRFMEMPAVVRRMLRTYVYTGLGRIREYDPTTLN